jgi:hypothetical protein
MSGWGQTRTSARATVRSASPPTPDIVGKISDVRFVPTGDIGQRLKGGNAEQVGFRAGRVASGTGRDGVDPGAFWANFGQSA